MPIPDQYPQAVGQALERMIDDLAPAAPEPSALVIYGSLAKGTYRPLQSDVNLAVVLERAADEVLAAIRKPLRAAWRAVRLQPFIVARDEIPRLADVFPVKLADIQAHHHVLSGDDPFAGVAIKPEHLRLRVEQELRNHLLRLRRQYAFVGHDDRELARHLHTSASSLGIELGALLRLSGESIDDPSLEAVTSAAVRAFDLDTGVLERLCAFKHSGEEDDISGLFAGVMAVLRRAVTIADRWGEQT